MRTFANFVMIALFIDSKLPCGVTWGKGRNAPIKKSGYLVKKVEEDS